MKNTSERTQDILSGEEYINSDSIEDNSYFKNVINVLSDLLGDYEVEFIGNTNFKIIFDDYNHPLDLVIIEGNILDESVDSIKTDDPELEKEIISTLKISGLY